MSSSHPAGPPQPGDRFVVARQQEPFTVAALVASFMDDLHGNHLYLVEATTGERWLLMPSHVPDAPVRWAGVPPVATHD